MEACHGGLHLNGLDFQRLQGFAMIVYHGRQLLLQQEEALGATQGSADAQNERLSLEKVRHIRTGL